MRSSASQTRNPRPLSYPVDVHLFLLHALVATPILSSVSVALRLRPPLPPSPTVLEEPHPVPTIHLVRMTDTGLIPPHVLEQTGVPPSSRTP